MFNQIKHLAYFCGLCIAMQLAFVSCQSDTSTTATTTPATVSPVDTTSTSITSTATATKAVNPPFNDFDVPYQRYAVAANKSQVIEIEETGTRIEIPKDAFVDANGNVIEGKVDIEFREFHGAASIITSGIIMQNEEGQYMESAGMFDIKGSQNGQEVFVAEGKEMMVHLASYNNSDTKVGGNQNEGFVFFELNEDKADWKPLCGAKKPAQNEAKISTLKKLDEELPEEPTKPKNTADNFVFNLQVNYTRFPEMQMFESVTWEYAGSKSDPNNPENKDDLFDQEWGKISLEETQKRGIYLLVLESKLNREGRRTDRYEAEVRPVLEGEDYEKAIEMFEQRYNDYQNVIAIQEETRGRLEQQANLVRSFAVNNFGIYNWDIWKDPARKKCQAELLYADNAFNALKYQNAVFLVTAGGNSVVNYNYEMFSSRFSYDPSERNYLVSVIGGNKIAVCTPDNFKKAREKNNVMEFEMKLVDIEVTNFNDFDKILTDLVS